MIKLLNPLGLVRRSEPMSRHTTLGVGGNADWYFRPDGRSEVVRAMSLIADDIPLLPLGRGSNLLIPDDGFSGMVIDLANLNQIRVEQTCVWVEAGVRMSKIAKHCADASLTGMEFMATVPGDAGGGVAMNAGAFGQQISDTLEQIDVVRRHGEIEHIAVSELDMAYRNTHLPEGALILSAQFMLREGDQHRIKERMRDMRHQRGDSQPLEHPNCGSVFKNPQGDYAARLIEQAGLKGLRIGHARISDKHANFIINEGGASSADVLNLIERAKQAVQEYSGIQLEPEVRMLESRI